MKRLDNAISLLTSLLLQYKSQALFALSLCLSAQAKHNVFFIELKFDKHAEEFLDHMQIDELFQLNILIVPS